MKTAKAVSAAIGGTLTALTTANAAVQLVLEDGAVNADEYGALGLAVATLIGSIVVVWRVPNSGTGATVRYPDGRVVELAAGATLELTAAGGATIGASRPVRYDGS